MLTAVLRLSNSRRRVPMLNWSTTLTMTQVDALKFPKHISLYTEPCVETQLEGRELWLTRTSTPNSPFSNHFQTFAWFAHKLFHQKLIHRRVNTELSSQWMLREDGVSIHLNTDAAFYTGRNTPPTRIVGLSSGQLWWISAMKLFLETQRI